MANPNLVLSPDVLSYGEVGVGLTSATQTVTLSNNGTGTAAVTGFTLNNQYSIVFPGRVQLPLVH